MTLTFLGAARTVTGSKHLLEVDGQRVLVDCGLFQGLKAARAQLAGAAGACRLDRAPSSSRTRISITAAICRGSSRRDSEGRIFCTPATAELARIVLADAAHLQEEDAERANRKGYTKHKPGAAALHRRRRRRAR